MPLDDQQKQDIKNRFSTLIQELGFFAQGDVKSLYVIDKKDLLKAAEGLGDLIPKIAKASWTRGKQGHGR